MPVETPNEARILTRALCHGFWCKESTAARSDAKFRALQKEIVGLFNCGVRVHLVVMHPAILLPHRSIVRVSGEDSEMFLNGLITQSVSDIGAGDRRWGALLTPQGKIIADFLVSRTAGDFFLECASSLREDLVQRLRRFRLRARVEVSARDDLCVAAFAGPPDPRARLAAHRDIVAADDAPHATGAGDGLADYHATRIAAGVAEAPFDFGPNEVFPADINMDLLDGVDFRKGCFVGQEVVSRMKRRGTSRRRTLTLRSDEAIAAPAPLLAGADDIGVVTSAADTLALARVRIDRLAEAAAAGIPLTVQGRSVEVLPAAWLAEEIAALKAS
jgi:tRNA-modifying protein YgfZ